MYVVKNLRDNSNELIKQTEENIVTKASNFISKMLFNLHHKPNNYMNLITYLV